jgi:hypothetical protein
MIRLYERAITLRSGSPALGALGAGLPTPPKPTTEVGYRRCVVGMPR